MKRRLDTSDAGQQASLPRFFAFVFGAFLGHEYSVIARNYGIGVLLMVCACILFRRREDRPLLVGLTLVLMANTSLHAALSALVILLVWALDSLGNRRSVSSSNRWV